MSPEHVGYVAGEWYLVVDAAPDSLLVALLAPTSPSVLPPEVWRAAAAGEGLDAVVDALTSRGVRAVSSFVALAMDGTETLVIAKGEAALALMLPTGKVERVAAPAAHTWTESSWPPASRWRLTPGLALLDAADPFSEDEDAGRVWSPLRSGIALAGSVRWSPATPARPPHQHLAAGPSLALPLRSRVAVSIPPATTVAPPPTSPASPTEDSHPAEEAGAEVDERRDAARPYVVHVDEATNPPADHMREVHSGQLINGPPARREPVHARAAGHSSGRQGLPEETSDPSPAGDQAAGGETVDDHATLSGVFDDDHDGLTVLGTIPRREAPVPDSGSAFAKLVFTSGRVHLLDGSVRIGRHPRPGRIVKGDEPRLVALPDSGREVSRDHVEVSVQGGTIVVRDVGSTNGTLVISPDGKEQRLAPGEDRPVLVGTRVELAQGVGFVVEPA